MFCFVFVYILKTKSKFTLLIYIFIYTEPIDAVNILPLAIYTHFLGIGVITANTGARLQRCPAHVIRVVFLSAGLHTCHLVISDVLIYFIKHGWIY